MENTPSCAFCGEPIDPRLVGVFHHVDGWVEARSSGSAHGVTLIKYLGEYAHKLCMQLRTMGVSSEQQSMF